MITLRSINSLIKMNSRLSCALLSTSVYKEEKVKVGKYNINYLKVGNGEHNVLCLPGAIGTIWTDFKPQIEGFNREKFSLIVWEPPGYGKSIPPEREFSANFYEKDADIAFQFMETLNIPKYSIMGWSDGATTCFILAAKHSEAIKKMVVWGANSFILPHELESYKKIQDVNSWSDKMREKMISIYGKEKLFKLWAEWMDTMTAVYNADNGNICSHLLKDIKCPIFILHGEKDPLVDHVHVTNLHTQVQDTRIHLYPEGKHNVHIKYADDFNKRVQEFLLQK